MPMKTLKISDDVHQKPTALLGELMAQIENFVEENKHFGMHA